MAETADILARPEQHVILPNLAAGCSMADMADDDSVEAALGAARWRSTPTSRMPTAAARHPGHLHELLGRAEGVLRPERRHRLHLVERGRPCSSGRSSAGRRVLFFPDQHLGRNTAKAMGVPLEQMPMWNPRKPLGGETPQAELQ